MNKIAFIGRRGPHGSAAGREGLDALLASSALTESLALFLIEDGVLQLVRDQRPQTILQRHYAPAFKLLELYDVEELYVCADSLSERGLQPDDLIIEARCLPRAELTRIWASYAIHLSF
ncbi:sulfurtransferase complex subunit TusC [Aeromonas molluscorum]|jgi:tRNA 2-thiouridine synthesizing protein C|uniref:Intracellular sulfur oxidation protein DsrF n=1 Tax=Aeromonas molluscorum 848 TaxID=1268236 RepID=R1H2R1_9GAMM|nr:sulfurtransferase complex subunit TusC [Aeromonas molluscorum]EOD54911.1 intracellular sulfur oxidation protein DsrF [Aeromonas molluscorum 848]